MATQLKITDLELKSPKPKDKTYAKHLGGGFYLYILPNGRKVARYCYQADGKRRRFELGEYNEGKGRAAALLKMYNVVHTMRTIQGIDPVAQQVEAKAAQESRLEDLERERSRLLARQLAEDNRVTIGDAATRFQQTYTGASANRQVAESTLRIYRWTVDKYIVPNFGHYPLDEAPIDEIMDFIEDLAETRPTASNQLHAIFSAFFKWVTKQRRYNSPELGDRRFRRNPLAGVDRPASTVRKNRVLDFKVSHKKFDNKGEFKCFWAWLPTINPGHANALRLLTLTGMRPSEVLGLQWEDVFADEIIVPAVKMKSQHDVHRIPFTPQLEALINDIRSTAGKAGDTDYLFPKRPRSLGSPDEGERSYPHVGHATLSNHILQALRSGELDIKSFTPHDIRRSVATHVGDLGFAPSEVDALQHHAMQGVSAHYNYSDPGSKKLAMLTAWHNRLDELIIGKRSGNVLDIRAAR